MQVLVPTVILQRGFQMQCNIDSEQNKNTRLQYLKENIHIIREPCECQTLTELGYTSSYGSFHSNSYPLFYMDYRLTKPD